MRGGIRYFVPGVFGIYYTDGLQTAIVLNPGYFPTPGVIIFRYLPIQ